MVKIVVVDEDKHQVILIKGVLEKYNIEVLGYDINNGMTSDELLNQVVDSDIDLLMIDFLLSDRGIVAFNGDLIYRKFQELRPQFPSIIFTSNEPDAFILVDNPNIIYEKDMATDPNKVGKFVSILEKKY